MAIFNAAPVVAFVVVVVDTGDDNNEEELRWAVAAVACAFTPAPPGEVIDDATGNICAFNLRSIAVFCCSSCWRRMLSSIFPTRSVDKLDKSCVGSSAEYGLPCCALLLARWVAPVWITVDRLYANSAAVSTLLLLLLLLLLFVRFALPRFVLVTGGEAAYWGSTSRTENLVMAPLFSRRRPSNRVPPINGTSYTTYASRPLASRRTIVPRAPKGTAPAALQFTTRAPR